MPAYKKTDILLPAAPLKRVFEDQLQYLSLVELAVRIRASDGWIRRILNGQVKKVELNKADQILHKLDLPLSWVYQDED